MAEPRRTILGKLTDKAICRGIFHGVPGLIIAIEAYLTANNQNP